MNILSTIKEKVSKIFDLRAFLGVLTALSILGGVFIHNNNVKLSKELEMANLNIETYQKMISDEKDANGVLLLTIDLLQNSNDLLLHKIDSVSKKADIDIKKVTFAETQTQSMIVKGSKGVGGLETIPQILYKDSIYNDSIIFNPETKVTYSIGTDSVCVLLDIKNTQYLYIYSLKQYKNKNKNFIQRLFTWDWKKTTTNKYKIYNTNDLIKTDSIRVVQVN